MHSNFKTFFLSFAVAVFISTNISDKAIASSAKSTTKEIGSDTKRVAKKGTRKIKDEVCEMIDGKMKCMAKKIKHAAKNTGDKVKDAVD